MPKVLYSHHNREKKSNPLNLTTGIVVQDLSMDNHLFISAQNIL